MMPDGYITSAQFARQCERARETVAHWCHEGWIAGAIKVTTCVGGSTTTTWAVPATADMPRRSGHRHPGTPGHLPVSPLLGWLRGRSDMEVALAVGVNPRAIYNLRHQKAVTEAKADRIASALGGHLTEIYPDYADRCEEAA